MTSSTLTKSRYDMTAYRRILFTGFLLLLLSASAIAADPSPPGALRYEIYSTTSAEVFWDRATDDGLVAAYEIKVNDDIIGNLDVLSYYFDMLTSGQQYTVVVTSTDDQGNRSEPASVSFVAGGGTASPSIPPDDAAIVAAPTGLKASVYSSSSAELFWDRSTTFGLTYEVTRNGSVVTTTDGTSYYLNDLTPGTTYTYQVMAIDRDGNRSIPASIMLNTQGGTSSNDPGISDVNTDIQEPSDLFQRDGYELANVIRLDVRTVTTPGTCTADDESGCTLTDVFADVDKTGDLTVDIPIHVSGDDFPDDGSVSNAELRLRGSGSRFAPQKSFRIKLDSKEVLWRNERYFQLNKHPFDGSRIRNKLAMDVMSTIPNLPSLRTQFVNLWIDDGNGPEDYGLFTHVERVNEYFLRNRGWNEDGNIYKAENFRFDKSDLSDILVDENGEPLDEDHFESTLEIENGDDHRVLQAMPEDINDPARTFESVLDQYFDRANVLAWVATNIMVHQADAVRHNLILYNPAGTQKFYFLPWDCDETIGIWREPPGDLSNDSLRQRSKYGYGLAARNVFLEGCYRLPGIHDKILQTVEYLRQNIVTNELMSEKVNSHFNLVAPFQERLPDSEHKPNFNMGSTVSYINDPTENLESLRTRFRIPIGPVLQDPQDQGSTWLFSWTPAYDPTGTSGGYNYRLQMATTPTFDYNTVVVDVGSIPDNTSLVTRNVDDTLLAPADYFARVIALPANEPERFFPVSGNKLYVGFNNYYGVIDFRAV